MSEVQLSVSIWPTYILHEGTVRQLLPLKIGKFAINGVGSYVEVARLQGVSQGQNGQVYTLERDATADDNAVRLLAAYTAVRASGDDQSFEAVTVADDEGRQQTVLTSDDLRRVQGFLRAYDDHWHAAEEVKHNQGLDRFTIEEDVQGVAAPVIDVKQRAIVARLATLYAQV